MIYQISIFDKISGKYYVESVDADNHPNAVKDAMQKLDKKLKPPTHLIEAKRKTAPKL